MSCFNTPSFVLLLLMHGSGYDIDNLQNDTEAVGVVSKKKKRILTALPQNQNQIHASVITRRKKVY